ncbi:hypothetical protein SAICODRAFT_30095 [Saitoella complicata NRRL Y-17804]|uniref:DUF985 domain-containing protein n=1 Tax=Saitoella complicata (strain BCRC 22490 / CBS 7301 / JCM 7358 / NBRC 10748 / NRRL Y-17804) TaxID=698492 RepID=A0A0E9NGU3_SAICN|nr:uncharacterized protein SAICODRAFT_30095 [Saitoella complicata NRRL Y-17804]ODQ53346.1 hypothetical protein SAICODRAFT_30095 [Saitoella complicata NRRL Y-17804]GAO48886.1 hypothetical protein G7K_3049-t1 [Saitoella complicata NRRL Y-17804]
MSWTEKAIEQLGLIPHPEGGYFKETDRATSTISAPASYSQSPPTRNLTTTIFYLLDSRSPKGHFHTNKSPTTHFHHRGRGIYVLIPKDGSRDVIEYEVGQESGRLQWIVTGEYWKASYLPEGEEGCLISEVVAPGFEFDDHEFMSKEELVRLVGEEKAKKYEWLLRKEEQKE